MNLSREQQEKLTLIIQAVLGFLVIALSVRSSAKMQTAQAKKLAKKEAKNTTKLNKAEYKMKKKLLKETYRQKYQNIKTSARKNRGKK